MKIVRNSLAGLMLGLTMTAAVIVGGGMFKDAQFAQAQERIEATRAQIANVQDLAAVYKAVGKAVEPSVVSLQVRKNIVPSALQRRFRNDNGEAPDAFPFEMPPVQGTGSGVIVETDGKTGYIVTNNHVASGAVDMDITLWDGREIKNAKLVGTDPKTDLAVIRIEADRLIPAKWGDSSNLEKGDIVMAFGSPLGFVGSMTHGIVSALNRDRVGIIRTDISYENFIQVDVPINPGNSGGPLVNTRAEVVGINTAIASENGGFQGIGFAIPSNQAKSVYDAIKSKGRVVRGFLGVEIEDASKSPELVAPTGYTGTTGVLVRRIRRETPAYGKLDPNDIITALNDKKVDTTQELRNQIAAIAPGTEVKLTVFRDRKLQDVTVKLGEQPDDTRAVASAQEAPVRNSANPNSAEGLGLRVAPSSEALIERFRLEADVKGAIVTGIRPNSLAGTAGLRTGDVITKVDGKAVTSPDELNDMLASADVSRGITLSVTNNESMRTVFIKSPDR